VQFHLHVWLPRFRNSQIYDPIKLKPIRLMLHISWSTTLTFSFGFANSGHFFQHIVTLNITETTDPNVERVTTFTNELTNLTGDMRSIGRRKEQQSSLPWRASSECPRPQWPLFWHYLSSCLSRKISHKPSSPVWIRQGAGDVEYCRMLI
jgi:hypothetical protein